MMLHHFENKGYREIKSDIQGRTKPIIIYGTKRNHIPDLTARKNATFVILEVELSSTIFYDHTTIKLIRALYIVVE